MVKPIVVYKEAGYLIRARHLTDEQIAYARKRFTHKFYDDGVCKKCDHLPDRHDETCDNCPAFKGERQLAKVIEHETADDLFLSLPYGATEKVRKFLKSLGRPYKVKDAHAEPELMSRPIRLLKGFKPREWQEEALPVMLEARKGVVKAPPRSGKTVFATMMILKIGCKSLIIAAQRDWLLQFQETFVGSETADAVTNAKPTQIKLCRTYEDFESTDVCLATVQQFMNERGKKLLERIRNMFHVVVADEVHLLPALESSRVIARFNSTYRIGLTGTPARKQEGLYEVINDLFGGVKYEAEVEQLRPEVEVVSTGLTLDIGQTDFTRFVNKVEYHKTRQDIIARTIWTQVQQGHVVLCPMLRTKAVDALVRKVNELAEEKIAAPFYGGLHKRVRTQTIADARTRKIKALIGNTKLLSTGLNIPAASCLIEGALSSNIPNCQQRTARILTPLEGKPVPKIIYILDNSKTMSRMRQTEWWRCVFPLYNPSMSLQTRAMFMSFLGGKQQAANSEASIRKSGRIEI